MNLELDKSNWEPVKFGDVVAEARATVRDPKAAGIERVVGLEHIEPECVHLRQWASIDEGTTFTKGFKKGHVLFGRRRAYLKKAALADFDGICSGDITVLEAKERLLPELLPFLVCNDAFFDYAVKHSAGGLSPRTKFKDIANYEFLLPPKDQQAKLAELLWAADESMTCFELLLVKTQSAYVSYIEKALINKAGSYVKATALGEIVRGVGYKPKELLEHKEDGAVVLLRSNNIQNGNLVLDNVHIIPKHLVKEKQLLVPGDHAVCMSNGSKELVGKAARYDSADEDLCVGSFCSVFRPSSSKNANLTSHLFSGETYRRRIKQILTGSNINNLKPDDFDLIGFRMLNDKNALNQVLNHCDVLLASKKQIVAQVDRSKVLLKSLINEIFSQPA